MVVLEEKEEALKLERAWGGWRKLSSILAISGHVLGELREEGRARRQTCENRVLGWLTWEDGK